MEESFADRLESFTCFRIGDPKCIVDGLELDSVLVEDPKRTRPVPGRVGRMAILRAALGTSHALGNFTGVLPLEGFQQLRLREAEHADKCRDMDRRERGYPSLDIGNKLSCDRRFEELAERALA